MKKMAFISSYDESCGNASFTEVLMNSIRKLGYEVDCLKLDLALTMSMENDIRVKADKHIQEICSKLKDYDFVNIQFEAGLYGTLPQDIKKRLLWLAKANSKTSVTLHSPRLINGSSIHRALVKDFLTGKFISAFKNYLQYKKNFIHYEINRSIVSELVKLNRPLIVHTNRAKEQIDILYSYKNVYVHPLMFIENDFVVDNKYITTIKENLDLKDSDIIIGMFGYISQYKGHTFALDAIKLLPKNYKLLIFGRVHPQTIKVNQTDDYLGFLRDKIKLDKLVKKVFFMGEYSDAAFYNIAGSVDIVWMPYMEVAQDGSGIASICMDVADKVVCSNAFSFNELFKLIKYNNVYTSDIGNSVEIAQKTLMAVNDNNLTKIKDSKYTIQTQAEIYITCIK